MNYGNGGVVAYGYDAFKRVTSVTYDHDAQPNYQYIYDGHGQVAQVRDLKTGTVVTSEYDLADRPMRKTTLFADGTRYVAQVSYDKYSNLQRFDEQLSNQGQFYTTFAHDVENRQ